MNLHDLFKQGAGALVDLAVEVAVLPETIAQALADKAGDIDQEGGSDD